MTYRINLGYDGSPKGFTENISSIVRKYIEEIRSGPTNKIKGIDETTTSMRHVNDSPREEVWPKE